MHTAAHGTYTSSEALQRPIWAKSFRKFRLKIKRLIVTTSTNPVNC
jgi:hypothetical protein